MSRPARPITNQYYFNSRIKSQLCQILSYPLTVVEAPMGYGKTTAVSEFLNGRNGCMALWLSAYENPSERFWKDFCGLFRQVDGAAADRLACLGFPADSLTMHEALDTVLAAVASGDVCLVIDDFQFVKSPEIHKFFELLARRKIPGLHIVLITRAAGFDFLDELKLKGYLLHIVQQSLELSLDEIGEYYRQCGLRLSPDEIKRAYSMTEGWISALYLLLLNYVSGVPFEPVSSIYRLLDKAVFRQLEPDTSALLLKLCHFSRFTAEQADYICQTQDSAAILNDLLSRNLFIRFDANAQSYSLHGIFTNLLKDKASGTVDSSELYERAGQWHIQKGEYLRAMRRFADAENYDGMLHALELDKGHSITVEYRDFLIELIQRCPWDSKRRHPLSLLVYAMCLFTFGRNDLFEKTCGEFRSILDTCAAEEPEAMRRLLGEFELLLSFTKYNDIDAMSQHHKSACALLDGRPSAFMDTRGCWTMGSPSVLYMFHREAGMLDRETNTLQETMPYYYRLTGGHGKGAELVMEAERRLVTGDFVNAEISARKAALLATAHSQPEIALCASFLLARVELCKGNRAGMLGQLGALRELAETSGMTPLLHTADLCEGYISACLAQNGGIPRWIAEGEAEMSSLYIPTMGFYNIVYGRALLTQGEYLKLLGAEEQFMGIASIFPNLQAAQYSAIYSAAANERLYRPGAALEALTKALDMAVPDQLYLPFAENGDFIKPLLAELAGHGLRRDAIMEIMKLLGDYEVSLEAIKSAQGEESVPALTPRETEIASLAAQGLTNAEIGRKLYISENTVKMALKSVFTKLSIGSRALLPESLSHLK